MNDLIFLYYKRVLYYSSRKWENFKFFLILNNPCYRSVWYTTFMDWFTTACICCTVTRAMIFGFFVGFILGRII
ncbi:MAG: hypothetical protein BWY21_01979 [Parcubacteria group bacterium ADurb.Bin216]|nr:MAG: hypothetical protein BWY21_01979 [Parcubacteria group bacterium ADurb.Bin216]